MADTDGFSLDDMLENIRREREIKAGLAQQQPQQHSQDGQQQDTDPADLLIKEYLADDTGHSPTTDTDEPDTSESTNNFKTNEYIIYKPQVYDGGQKSDYTSIGQRELNSSSVDEEQAERILRDNRKKKIDEFRVFASGISDEALLEIEQKEEKRGKKRAEVFNSINLNDGQGLFDAVDKTEPKRKKKKADNDRFFSEAPIRIADEKTRLKTGEKSTLNINTQKKIISEMKNKANFSALVSGIITVVLFFLAVLPHFYQAGGTLESLIGSSGRVYLCMNLALTILALCLSYDMVRSSVKSILKLTPNADTVVLIALLFSTLQNIILLVEGDFIASGGTVYNCVAAFSLFLNSLTKRFVCNRMDTTLKTLMKNPSLHTVQTVDNRADAKQLAYGISDDGTPTILYSVATQLPDEFHSISTDRRTEEKFFSVAVPALLGASVILGILGAVVKKDVFGFINCCVGCICMCLPVAMTFISNLLIMKTNKTLSKDGSAVLGYCGISDIEDTNAFIMDSKEIFYGEVSNFHIPKYSNLMTEEEAITYTGAVLSKGNCVLSEVFMQLIQQQNIMLPAVEDLKYEDRLGFSAWINDDKVLVGNRSMMTQHNVQLPPATTMEADETNEVTTMYVAVEEQLVAMFNVRYLMGKNVAKQIRRLTDNGVVLMLMTKDPGITEEFVSTYAKIGSDSVKITNSKSYDIMKLYTANSARKRESGLICKNSSGSALRLINAAFRLINADRQSSVSQMISLVFAAVFSVIALLVNRDGFISPLIIILYQIICTAVSCLMSERTLDKK